MKVLFDHQIFSLQATGGISRLFHELIRNAKEGGAFHPTLAIRVSNNLYIQGAPYLQRPLLRERAYSDFLKNVDFKGKRLLYRAVSRAGLTRRSGPLNLACSRKSIERQLYDVFQPTYYSPYFLDIIKKPFVLFIFDMIHELYPNYFGADDLAAAHKRLLAGKASRVVAISNNTREDAIRILGANPDAVDVVYPGFTPMKGGRGDLSTAGLPPKYLLFVGSRGLYKNFSNLVAGVETICRKDKELHVYCAGGGPFTAEELSLIQKRGLKGRVVRGDLDDAGLSKAYRCARALVFPSLYEGFGFPVLEAFSAGCPVVLSNRGSLPELARDAGIYFNPEDKEDIEEKIGRLLCDQFLRSTMISKGYVILRDFSWEKAAAEMSKTYDKAAGG